MLATWWFSYFSRRRRAARANGVDDATGRHPANGRTGRAADTGTDESAEHDGDGGDDDGGDGDDDDGGDGDGDGDGGEPGR